MELEQIALRYSQAISDVDANDPGGRVNPRTLSVYEPGVAAMGEADLVAQVDRWWVTNHPAELDGAGRSHRTGVRYPRPVRGACDHVINTDGGQGPEWAIEVKRLQLVGNNGKRNDFAVPKMISPYLKDRSLLHDVARLREYRPARRQAVIAYAFAYNDATLTEAAVRHGATHAALDEIEKVVRTNGGSYDLDSVVNFCDGILRVRNMVTGVGVIKQTFEAWRHPCGGRGAVYAWEIADPFDPRHPW